MHKKRFATRMAGVVLAAAALAAHGQDAAKAAPARPSANLVELVTSTDSPLNGIAWLAGCWAGRTGKVEFREHWMRPAAGMMLGMGRTTTEGKLVGYEAMRIELDAGGVPVFVAKPSDKPEARFKSVNYDEKGISFENPDHEFPQRIKYQLKADGSLDARIEGNYKGREARVEFPMKRTSCE